MTKQLPNAPDAERSMLCCILHNPDRFLIRASSDNITPEFFYNATNQRIFQIIHEQHQQGKNIDVTSVSEMIRDRKEANLSVADLGDIMLSEHSENSWQDYAEILRDRYARRLAIEAGQQVASQNLSGESAVFALKQAAEAAMNALVGSTAIQRAGDAAGGGRGQALRAGDLGDVVGAAGGVFAGDRHGQKLLRQACKGFQKPAGVFAGQTAANQDQRAWIALLPLGHGLRDD